MNVNLQKQQQNLILPISKQSQLQREKYSQQQLFSNPNKKNLKLISKNLNFDQLSFDLPIKELQYTKTRKYKQNLNPVIQSLNTTLNRYHKESDSAINKHSNQSNQQFQKYLNYGSAYNDGKGNGDSQNNIIAKAKNEGKVQHYKERANKLNQIIKQENNQNNQTGLYSFGQLHYPIEPSFVESRKIKNRYNASCQTLDLLNLRKHQQNPIDVQIQNKNSLNSGENLISEDYWSFKDSRHCQKQKADKSLINYCNRHQNNDKTQGQYFVYLLQKEIKQMRIQFDESEEKLGMLRKQIEMHKQKNILKQKQFFILKQQHLQNQNKSIQLSKKLEQLTKERTKMEDKHHGVQKQLKKQKLKLKKEEMWLIEQSNELKLIQERYDRLMMIVKELEKEQREQQDFCNEIQTLTEKKKVSSQHLEELRKRVSTLKDENNVLEEQTITLQLHQDQLASLQEKFIKQTQKLKNTHQQLKEDIQMKEEFINQQDEVEEMLKEMELEMGQMNYKQIALEQEMQDINLKIDLKKRNITNFQNSRVLLSPLPELFFTKKTQQSFLPSSSPVSSKVFTRSHPRSKNIQLPLSAIKQQSKNTSKCQSPLQKQQYLNNQINQTQSFPSSSNPIETSSYQIQQQEELGENSRQISRTQIYKPHVQDTDMKLKKYLVVESEQDKQSEAVNQLNELDEHIIERKSEQIFIEEQRKPSIQHRLMEETNYNKFNNTDEKKKAKSTQLSPSKFRIDKQSSFKKDQTSKVCNRQKQQNQFKNKKDEKSNQEKLNSSSEQAIESLIYRYEKIKSNSFFNQGWKDKI